MEASRGKRHRTGNSKRLWVILCPIIPLALSGVVAARSYGAAMRNLHPPRESVPSAQGARLSGVVDISFTTSDGLDIRGWYVPSRNGAAVVLCHGFGNCRTQLLFEARLLSRRDYGVLLFDWRGQGESDGVKVTWGDSERNDLFAALDWLSRRAEINPRLIGAVGFSMGGSVVAEVAAADSRLAAIALEGTFTSLEDELWWDMGKWGPISSLPAVWAFKRAGVNLAAVRPVDAVSSFSPRPVLLINGTDDPHSPEFVQERLYRACGEPKQYYHVVGASHGNYSSFAPKEYSHRLISLFDSALLAPQQKRQVRSAAK